MHLDGLRLPGSIPGTQGAPKRAFNNIALS